MTHFAASSVKCFSFFPNLDPIHNIYFIQILTFVWIRTFSFVHIKTGSTYNKFCYFEIFPGFVYFLYVKDSFRKVDVSQMQKSSNNRDKLIWIFNSNFHLLKHLTNLFHHVRLRKRKNFLPDRASVVVVVFRRNLIRNMIPVFHHHVGCLWSRNSS